MTIVTPSRKGPPEPRAYRLALSRRSTLIEHYTAASERLTARGRGSVLRGFEVVIAQGKAAINMSMDSLVRFLNSGRWLNIYEAVAEETGLKGTLLEHEVVDRLREYGKPRLRIDHLFRFRRDTHYASLNLGGVGPFEIYGICCVVFDLSHWAPRHTCFAGDSILSCFDAEGKPVLPEDEALRRFATGDALRYLTVVEHEVFLENQLVFVDRTAARELIEGRETMIEIHLHGKVLKSQIAEVRLPHGEYIRLCSLEKELAKNPDNKARKLDPARAFRRMREALERYDVPLIVGGES